MADPTVAVTGFPKRFVRVDVFTVYLACEPGGSCVRGFLTVFHHGDNRKSGISHPFCEVDSRRVPALNVAHEPTEFVGCGYWHLQRDGGQRNRRAGTLRLMASLDHAGSTPSTEMGANPQAARTLLIRA